MKIIIFFLLMCLCPNLFADEDKLKDNETKTEAQKKVKSSEDNTLDDGPLPDIETLEKIKAGQGKAFPRNI